MGQTYRVRLVIEYDINTIDVAQALAPTVRIDRDGYGPIEHRMIGASVSELKAELPELTSSGWQATLDIPSVKLEERGRGRLAVPTGERRPWNQA